MPTGQMVQFILRCLILVSLSVVANAATWHTKQFKFESTNPKSAIPLALQSSDDYSEEELKTIKLYEKYLTKVAARYESMGFKAPPLPIVEGRDGGDAYLIHFFDYDDNLKSAAVKHEEDLTVWMRVDQSRNIRASGKPLPDAYDNLAHELFHAVQRAYQKYYDADPANWIMEGQAQAVGMFIAREFEGVDIHAGTGEDFRIGGRPYYKSITNVDESPGISEDYRTSSFWRYVGEYYAASKKNQRPGMTPIDPDYRYLVDLLELPYPSQKGSKANDLKWVDGGLRRSTGLSFSRLYANFISSFAEYYPARMAAEFSGDVSAAKKGWLKYVYGGCPFDVNLTATQIAAGEVVKLEPNASRCFKVKVFGEGKAYVTIQTLNERVEPLRALRIGAAGGAQVASPVVAPSPSGGGYIARWRFGVTGGGAQTFVIANMGDNPVSTPRQEILLDISSDFWDTNLTEPDPQKAASKPKSKPKPGDATRAAAREDVRDALKSLSNRTPASAHVNWERNRPKCAKPFGATGCGPITSIQLSLTPGTLGDMSATVGTGGGLGQFMSQLSAIADNGVFSTDNDWRAAMERSRDMEGSSVVITIPAIEYGFKGSFSNAAIVVNGGAGKGNYQALGPRDAIPGRGREYRQSGRVAIEEFTPFILRGSFQADLTDMSRVTFSEADPDYALPVHRSLRGRFAITAPWEGDPRVTSFSADPSGSDVQDLYEAFPALKNFDLGEIASANAPTGNSGNGGSFPARPINGVPSCDCGCAISGLSQICMPICKPAVLACGEQRMLENVLANAAKATQALENDADRMRSDFEDYLKIQWHGDQTMVDMYLGLYDEQTSPQEKRRIAMAQGMDVSAYGDDEVQRRAANPAKPTREEYIAGLKANGIPQPQIDNLVRMMDAEMAKRGGWPK
jgi:hypothetical protein